MDKVFLSQNNYGLLHEIIKTTIMNRYEYLRKFVDMLKKHNWPPVPGLWVEKMCPPPMPEDLDPLRNIMQYPASLSRLSRLC